MYKRENYRKIIDDLKASRDAAEQAADQRSEMLCRLSEEFRAVETELRSTGMQLFKLACMGKDLTPLMERNQFLNKERERLILSLGYPADFTDPIFPAPSARTRATLTAERDTAPAFARDLFARILSPRASEGSSKSSHSTISVLTFTRATRQPISE